MSKGRRAVHADREPAAPRARSRCVDTERGRWFNVRTMTSARMFASAFTALIVLVWTGDQTAAQSKPAPAAGRPAYELAGAAIQGLTAAVAIEESLDRIDRNRLGDRGGRFDATSEVRRAIDRSRDAAALFNRQFGASNDPLRRSAGAMRNAFTTLSSGLNEVLTLWDKLNTSTEESELSDLVRSSAARLTDERPWQMLHKATQDTSLALLDVSRAAVPGDIKSARHLRLTKSEREIIVAQLKTAFPRLAAGAGGTGRTGEVAAGELLEFLSRPYLAEDEQ